jgi:glycosyltransferase involved in cell wall biosynthesis
MSKVKVLVVEVKNAGVGKFRFSDPHITLQKNHKDDFIVDIMDNPPIEDKDFISFYDIIVLQGTVVMNDNLFKILENLKKQGLKIVLDIDDYWRLSPSHAMYKKMEETYKTLVERLKIADLITTTTVNLARELLRFNKNVKVLENAINPEEEQFISNPIESNKVRIGWAGGSSHLEDLKCLGGLSNHIHNKHYNEVQLIMAGFDNKIRNIQTGEITTTKRPELWMQCEMLFTNNYKMKDDNYIHYLLHPREEEYENIQEQSYKRIWSKPIHSYAKCYNEIDIALAPLKINTFNSMKSQLKVLEAGFHKKPLIASEIYPYQLDIVHGKNGFLVPEKRNHKEWYEYSKALIRNENMRKEMGEALYETVKDKYDLNNVTRKRASLYKNL